MPLQLPLNQRPRRLGDMGEFHQQQVQVAQFFTEPRRMVVSRDAGGTCRDWFLVCASGHAPWCSLPFLEHDAALYGTCEVCAELAAGSDRLARVRR